MSSHQRFGIILAGTLLVSVAPMKMTPAQQQPAPARTKTVGSYAEAKTLSNALPLLKQQIADDHKMSLTLKKQLAPLLTEQAVKQKIRSALSDYEAKITEAEEKTYFQKTIAPVYQRIAQTGKLSKGATFRYFSRLESANGTAQEGIGLRLEVKTPGAKYAGFALPIIDIWQPASN